MQKKRLLVLSVFLVIVMALFVQGTEGMYDDETIKECNVSCKVWEFFFGSSEARAGKGWFDRSEALVGEATEVDMEKADKLHQDALALAEKGDHQGAIAKLDQAIALNSADWKNHAAKAQLLADSEKYKEAVQSYQVASQDPNIPADRKLAVGQDRAKALQEYAKSPGINPADPFTAAGYTGDENKEAR